MGVAFPEEFEESFAVLFGETSREKSFESFFDLEVFSAPYFDWWSVFFANRDTKSPEAVLAVGVKPKLEFERCFFLDREGVGKFEHSRLVLTDSSEINGPSGAIGIGVEGRNCG